MKGYKSSVSRLARFFKTSRDAWKEKAKESQEELRQIKKEQQSASEEGRGRRTSKAIEGTILRPETEERAMSAPARHHYPVFVMQLGIQQIVQSLNSLRGSQGNFELFAQFFAVPTPSYILFPA